MSFRASTAPCPRGRRGPAPDDGLKVHDARAVLSGIWVRPSRYAASVLVKLHRAGGGKAPPLGTGLVALRSKLAELDPSATTKSREVSLALEGWPSNVDAQVIEVLRRHLQSLNPADVDPVPPLGHRTLERSRR